MGFQEREGDSEDEEVGIWKIARGKQGGAGIETGLSTHYNLHSVLHL